MHVNTLVFDMQSIRLYRPGLVCLSVDNDNKEREGGSMRTVVSLGSIKRDEIRDTGL
jgi:hypothetical protein